jgi:2-succinyl-5-enolpyruvyl-6-hydroxy-3-cyclohexene-1-carboxylate synthase
VCPGRGAAENLVRHRRAQRGFFALGLAKQSRSPVVLVATSGTAGAHFYPAVIEAAMAQVPLVVLTADRPLELQGWGAPQTVPQARFFGDFARLYADVGLPEASDAALMHLRATVARAVVMAMRAPKGAVQLNVPFREPLAPTPDAELADERLSVLAREGRAGGTAHAAGGAGAPAGPEGVGGGPRADRRHRAGGHRLRPSGRE